MQWSSLQVEKTKFKAAFEHPGSEKDDRALVVELDFANMSGWLRFRNKCYDLQDDAARGAFGWCLAAGTGYDDGGRKTSALVGG